MKKVKNTILHNGRRLVCRIFENREYGDCFTIAFKGYRDKKRGTMVYPYLASSVNPYSPMGIGHHGESSMFIKGRELGKRVSFESLPAEVKRFILENI